MLSCNSHKHISPSTKFVINTPKATRGGTRCTYRQAVDRGAAGSSLVPQNDTKSSYRADSLLPSLWGRSSYPHRTHLRVASSACYDEVEQDQHRRDDDVLLEENRLQAATRAARYQQAPCRYHSHRVHAWCFEEGDLVLRRVQSAKGTNKLSPKWEGPYRVVQVTRPSTVRLEIGDGTQLQNSWNIEHLRKYYP